MWGIGTNYNKDGTIRSYGYPESNDPRLFKPDFEVCTFKEIKRWENDIISTELKTDEGDP